MHVHVHVHVRLHFIPPLANVEQLLSFDRHPKAYRCTDLLFSFVMEKVDLVMVGAEGVAESGGIINKVYTVCNDVTIRLWLVRNGV